MRLCCLLSLGLLVAFSGSAIAEPDLVTQGKVLLSNGEPEKALAKFEAAYKANPKNMDAVLGMGDCYIDLGQPDDVIRVANIAFDLDEKDARPRLLLAEGNLKKAEKFQDEGRPDNDVRLFYMEARRRAEEALELDAKTKGANCIIAQAILFEISNPNRNAEALERVKKEVALDPNNVMASWLLGNLLFVEAKDYAGSVTALKRVVKLSPKHLVAWKWLGAALLKTNDRVGAAHAFLEACKLSPYDTYAMQQLYNSSLDRGKATPAENHARLIRNLETLITALGGDTDARACRAVHQLAWALNDSGNPKEALKRMDRVIKAFPDYVGNYSWMYELLKKMNKMPEAIQNLKKAVELKPDNTRNFNRLYKLALRMRIQPRIQMLEWLFKVGGEKNGDIANDLGFTHRDGTRDYKKSLKWYLKASELSPRNVDILNDTGLIYQYHMANPAKAMEYYEKVLEIGRDDHAGELEMGRPPRGYGDALENMAMIYIDRKQFSKAKTVLDELLGYYPRRPKALLLKSQLPQ